MPSAKPSEFKGGGGILRDQDGTVVSLELTTDNPLYTDDSKKGSFNSLFAVVGVRQDGSEEVNVQPIWVGNADDFEITEDKMGLIGGELSKGSSFHVFLESVSKTEFDEDNYEFDEAANMANWSALVGGRFRFNWVVDEKANKRLGQKKSKKPDPKTGKFKLYDRENLIVTNYYGQVEVEEQTVKPTPAAKKPGLSSAKPPAAPAVKQGAAKGGAKGKNVVFVEDQAKALIIEAIGEKKGKPLSKSKLSVVLLNKLGTVDAQLRTDIRTWANDNDNLGAIDGVVFNAETAELTLDAAE